MRARAFGFGWLEQVARELAQDWSGWAVYRFQRAVARFAIGFTGWPVGVPCGRDDLAKRPARFPHTALKSALKPATCVAGHYCSSGARFFSGSGAESLSV